MKQEQDKMVMARFRMLCTSFSLLAILSVTSALDVGFGDPAPFPINCSSYKLQLKGTFQKLLDVFSKDNGSCTVAPEYQNRLDFSSTSLSIRSVRKNDEGWYVQTCDGNISDLRLVVVDPHVQTFVEGEMATLHCYADTKGKSSSVYQWEKDKSPVATLSEANITYHDGFKTRFSVPLENLKNGDLSLTITLTKSSDAGQYKCSHQDDVIKLIRFSEKDSNSCSFTKGIGVTKPVWITLIIIIIIIIILLAIGVCIYCWRKQKQPKTSGDCENPKSIELEERLTNPEMETNCDGTVPFAGQDL